MKVLKNNIKLIIAFLLGVILSGGIVFAYTSANQVSYTRQGTNISNVEGALNDLYSKMSNETKVITSEGLQTLDKYYKNINVQIDEEVGTLTNNNESYTFQNDGYIIGTACSSNGKNAILRFTGGQSYLLAIYDDSKEFPVSLYITKGTTVTTRDDGGIYDLKIYETNHVDSQEVGTLTNNNESYTFQNDGYIIGTASSSDGGNATINIAENQDCLLAPHNVSTTYPVSLYIKKGTTVTTGKTKGVYNLTIYEFD